MARDGFVAKVSTICRRCGRDITAGRDRVVWANRHRDDVIHVGCASGADE